MKPVVGDGLASARADSTIGLRRQDMQAEGVPAMTSMKSYPSDLAPGTFAVADDASLPEITPEEQAVVDAATERAERYYRENPDAEETDRRLNDELRDIARRAHSGDS